MGGLVVGQPVTLRPHDFTRARASKSSKVTILPRRDDDAEVPSANNNNIYRIYYYSTTIISHKRRRDEHPGRGHSIDAGTFSHSVGGARA